MKHQPTNDFTFDPLAVSRYALECGVSRFFQDRIRDLADHASTTHGSLARGRRTLPFVSVKVSPGWPMRGTIELKRQDGAVFALHLHRRRTWKVERLRCAERRR